MTNLKTPLTESGNVRCRIVAGYQDNDSWLDRYNNKKTFFSGIIDTDLSDSMSLSPDTNISASIPIARIWAGLPRWNSDGSVRHYDRAHSTAPDWAYNDKKINKFFVTLT